MTRHKIFVSAYACEPGLGSEIGVGWHWVLEMSKYFDLWVLTRESNRHTIEPWIAEHPEFAGINWLYFDLPKWARFWKKGMRGVRIYYNIWQMCTYRIVRKTMQENDIKIYHHLTYGNALWRVSSYGAKQFFIWGPIGGLETIPTEFSKHYDTKWKIIEFVRRIIIKLLPINIGINNRFKNANLILSKTKITQDYIPEQYRNKSVLQTDVAVEKLPEFSAKENKHYGLKLVSIGRLDAWRGFDLIIEALTKAVKSDPNIHLTIVGKGSDRKRLEQIAMKNNVIKNITFTGNVSHDEYLGFLSESDAVVNASLKEGAVTVSFDAMSMGKPLICIDTTGYTRYFNSKYAIIIPLSSRSQIIDNISNAILKLTDIETRKEMERNADSASKCFTWEFRGKEICKLITDQLESNAKNL